MYGNYSVDALAGDLVLRPADGSRLILARGSDSPDHQAAVVIDPNGKVGIGTTGPPKPGCRWNAKVSGAVKIGDQAP